jgi:hypothetical protein
MHLYFFMNTSLIMASTTLSQPLHIITTCRRHSHSLYCHSHNVQWRSHGPYCMVLSRQLSPFLWPLLHSLRPVYDTLRLYNHSQLPLQQSQGLYKHFLTTFTHSHGFYYTLTSSFGTLVKSVVTLSDSIALSRHLLALSWPL